MLPPINFILYIINLFISIIDNLDIIDDHEIPNILMLTGLINIVNMLSLIIQNLDIILTDDRRENDIYKLIRLCDQYR